jgi:hypothetical protein
LLLHVARHVRAVLIMSNVGSISGFMTVSFYMWYHHPGCPRYHEVSYDTNMIPISVSSNKL